MDIDNTIGVYAKLKYQAERYEMAGQKVPAEIASAVRSIEQRAPQIMHPGVLQVAMRQARGQIEKWHDRDAEQAQLQQQLQDRKGVEDYTKEFTAGMFGQQDGLTPEQFNEMLDEGKVTFKARRKMTDEERIALTKKYRQGTKHIDPKGNGYTQPEWEALLDDLADTPPERLHGKIKAKGLIGSPAQLEKMVNKWRGDRIGLEMHRRSEKRDQERDDSTEDTVIELNDEQKRRATITSAFIDDEIENTSNGSHYAPKTTEEYEQDEDSGAETRAALSAAWDYHEATGTD